MQLTKSIEMKKVKNLVRKGIFFIIVGLLSQVPLFGIKGLLGMTMLSIAYVSGYEFVLMYFVAMGLSFNVPLVILSVGIYVLLELTNLLHLLKSFLVPIVVSLLIGIYVNLMYFDFSIAGISESLLILLSQYMLQTINLELTNFFVHTHARKVTKREYTLLLSLLIIALMNVVPYNANLVLTLVYAIILYSAYSLSLTSASYLGLFSLFLFIFMQLGSVYDLVTMMFPMIVFNVYKPKNKFIFAFLFILSNAWIPFLSIETLKIQAIKIGIATLIFLIVPAIKNSALEARLSTSAQLENDRGKMKRKVLEFSELFNKITSSFQIETTPTNTKLYVGHLYDEVCKECTCKDQCFDRYNGNHRLIKLFMKGLDTKLQLHEMKYVQNYCLNAKQYKDQLKVETTLFEQQEKMNKEYDLLKKNLYEQLMVVSSMLTDFQNNLTNQYTSQDDYVMDLLKGYHFDVEYLHCETIANNQYELDLGVKNITANEVIDDLIPLLNLGYNTTFRLKKQTIPKHKGYVHLILENKTLSYLTYGVFQSSKDDKFCGDQYAVFDYGNKNVLAISDGMGHGKVAYDESSFLLDVLQKLIKTGVGIEKSITTMNALLKIKNRSDMFTTLDLAVFNPYKNEIEFYKNGSMHSFIIRDEAIVEIEGRTLPIGIMSEVETKHEKYELRIGDYIVMLSDGIDEGEETRIIDYIIEHNKQNPQMIASTFSTSLEEASAIDDVTLLVMRVEG